MTRFCRFLAYFERLFFAFGITVVEARGEGSLEAEDRVAGAGRDLAGASHRAGKREHAGPFFLE